MYALACPCAAVISSEAVKPGSVVVPQPFVHAQTALITTTATTPGTQVQLGTFPFFIAFIPYYYFTVFKSSVISQVEIVGKPQPATPSQPATPGTEHELQQYRKYIQSSRWGIYIFTNDNCK